MKIHFYKIILILIAVFISLIMPAGMKTNAYRDIFYNYLNSTGEIENTTITKEGDEFNISLSTSGYDKGYYTEFFTPNEYMDLTGMSSVSVSIKNNCAEKIRINFVCSTEEKEYKIQDESSIFIRDMDTQILEETKAEYGTFSIDGNRNVTLYIPLKSLNIEGINHINNFGFTVTCEEDKTLNFVVKDFKSLNEEEGKQYNDMLSINIVGDDEIFIPTEGESISEYKLEGIDGKVYFSVLENVRGVYIDGDGVLHVKESSEQGRITLKIEGENGNTFYKSVNLKNSWVKDTENSDQDFTVPENLTAADSSQIKFFTSSSTVMLIEAAGIMLAVLFIIIYMHWKRYVSIDWKVILACVIVYFLFVGLIIFRNAEDMKKQAYPEIYKTMNIGNALEAPKDIKWDVTMNEEYLDKIKEAGFDAVRIPVRFSDYTLDDDNYLLDEDFMEKVDYYVDYALKSKLNVILDMHHFTQIMEEPVFNRDKLLAMWRQISERYKDYPDSLVYEILNEPKDNLTEEIWNELASQAVQTIRKQDKKKYVIIGGIEYNSYEGLLKLNVPKDKRLILTFHYYSPNDFTFQGEQYHEGYENLSNIEWKGSKQEVEEIDRAFNIVSKFAEKEKLKIFLGEFGANKNAPRESRILWTKTVREEAEKYDFAWGYWELASSFGIYDSDSHNFDKEMLEALGGYE